MKNSNINPDDSPFGDEIFRYTRKDAIRDGYLLDITSAAKQRANLELPAAITLGLWEHVAPKQPFRADHPVVPDLCDGVAFALAGLTKTRKFELQDGEILFFEFKSQGIKHAVKLVLGPGDHGEPVVTIMLPNED